MQPPAPPIWTSGHPPTCPSPLPQVVYLPTCVTRMMGPAGSDSETASVHEKLMSLFGKAGYEVVLPKGVESLCCGMMFNRCVCAHVPNEPFGDPR